jgi:hypothetical protein
VGRKEEEEGDLRGDGRQDKQTQNEVQASRGEGGGESVGDDVAHRGEESTRRAHERMGAATQ